jgi:hypothetical protein
MTRHLASCRKGEHSFQVVGEIGGGLVRSRCRRCAVVMIDLTERDLSQSGLFTETRRSMFNVLSPRRGHSRS